MLILLSLPSPFLRPVLYFPPFPRTLLLRHRRALATALERDATAARPATRATDVFVPQFHHTAHRRLHTARRGSMLLGRSLNALSTVTSSLGLNTAASFPTTHAVALRQG